jgi:DNA-directed RNA polymerase I, II, and III subunit RPABC2
MDDDDGGYGGGEMEDLEDEEEELEDEEEEEETPDQEGFAVRDADVTVDSKAIPIGQHTTTKYMTKYEKARILGTRALQIRSPQTLF